MSIHIENLDKSYGIISTLSQCRYSIDMRFELKNEWCEMVSYITRDEKLKKLSYTKQEINKTKFESKQ